MSAEPEEQQRGSFEPGDTFQFEFSSDVPAGTAVGDDFTVEQEIPYDGRIQTFIVGWPAGANNLVGVQLYNLDTELKLFPYDDQNDFIGANNFTHPFDLHTNVDESDVLVVQYVNNDTGNNHFMNAIVTVEVR